MKISSINASLSQNATSKQTSPNFKRNWAEHVSWGANYAKETGKTNFKLFAYPDAKSVFVEIADKAITGLDNIRNRIVEVVAAVGASIVINDVHSKDKDSAVYPMENKGDGVFEAKNIDAKPDDKYRYIIVTKDNAINIAKDPYTKKQIDINGWSSIYDKDNYEWKNIDWLEGKDSRRIVRKPNEKYRGLERLVIDEVNIPTLTKEGTFESAKKRVDVIAERGIATAIELLPVENTFSKQWGYDGVDKFAVNEKLGGAKQLKELIDYAHGKGLNVIMDMVPNHEGPDGDALYLVGPYEKGAGSFGAQFNYEGKDNRYVRDWMSNAALWWANEFHVDGIRFDMTKETASDYLLKQLVEELNEHNPQVFTIAEDGRNNKYSVTRYDETKTTHTDTLDFIDMNIEFINSRNWKSTPHAVGFDTEWDFPFMHALKSAIIGTNTASLNELDNLIKNSQHRVKYILSHDEIGNMDGTRLVPKILAQTLNLFNSMEGYSDGDRGQKAAQLAQKLFEVITTNPNLTGTELAKLQSDYGLTKFYSKKIINSAIETALAKSRLAQGTLMTIPGPKMYFQGEDNVELAHFKFFREFSGERDARQTNPKMKENAIAEKGYDPFIDFALPDSVIDQKKPSGCYENMQNNMVVCNQVLADLLKKNKAFQTGEITHLYKDFPNVTHIHGLKDDEGNEFLIIKNFADSFHPTYSYPGFPRGTWLEVFNSDDRKYGGGGNINTGRVFSANSQNINIAANSISILRRIS